MQRKDKSEKKKEKKKDKKRSTRTFWGSGSGMFSHQQKRTPSDSFEVAKAKLRKSSSGRRDSKGASARSNSSRNLSSSSDYDFIPSEDRFHYHPTVIGLERLDQSPIPPRGDKDKYEKGAVLANFINLEDKPGGVEPGFLAVEINDEFIARFNYELDLQCQSIGDCIGEIQNMEWFDLGSEKHDKYYNLLNRLIDEGKGKIDPPEGFPRMKLLLFKQDYNEPTMRGVAPPVERLIQSNTIQSAPGVLHPVMGRIYQYGRTKKPPEENVNAILECLASEVARAFGMLTQVQQLYFGTYAELDILKILTLCEWDPEMENLKECIAGSARKKDYENYLVKMKRDASGKIVKDKKGKPVKMEHQGYSFSDSSIIDLGLYFPFAISQGNDDDMGSRFQNKGRKGKRIFVFDTGHAYRGVNPLIRVLNDDFSFSKPIGSEFKNFSALSDTVMCDRMEGLFCLYRIAEPHIRSISFDDAEQKVIERALQTYFARNPAFKERYEQVKPECFDEIFLDYYFKFIQLGLNENDSLKRAEYFQYAKQINNARKEAIYSITEMFNIFNKKMKLDAIEVGLLENLDKFTSGTSLTSTDGQVILSHLRVIPEGRLSWNLGVTSNDNLYFSCNLHKSSQANEMFLNLDDFMKHHNVRDDIHLRLRDNEIIIELANPSKIEEAMQNLSEIFNENNIIRYKVMQGLIERSVIDAYASSYDERAYDSRKESTEKQEELTIRNDDKKEEESEELEEELIVERVAQQKENESENVNDEVKEEKEEKEEESREENREPSRLIHEIERLTSEIDISSSGAFTSQPVIAADDMNLDALTKAELFQIVRPLIKYLTYLSYELMDESNREKLDKDMEQLILKKIKLARDCVSDILNGSRMPHEVQFHIDNLIKNAKAVDARPVNKLAFVSEKMNKIFNEVISQKLQEKYEHSSSIEL